MHRYNTDLGSVTTFAAGVALTKTAIDYGNKVYDILNQIQALGILDNPKCVMQKISWSKFAKNVTKDMVVKGKTRGSRVALDSVGKAIYEGGGTEAARNRVAAETYQVFGNTSRYHSYLKKSEEDLAKLSQTTGGGGGNGGNGGDNSGSADGANTALLAAAGLGILFLLMRQR